jgi:hypothetical protein
MTDDIMGGQMMWGMEIAGVIGLAVVVLVIAALINYVLFK